MSEPISGAPELIVDIDVNDEVYYRKDALNAADIKQLVTDLKAQGVEVLLIRCGCVGLLPYHTNLSYPMRFDENRAREFHSSVFSNNIEEYIGIGKGWMNKWAETLQQCNPPEVFIQEGHKYGMKVLCWIDLFDDGTSGWRSKFLDENPHCRWVARDGKTFFHGLMDYAWPEARAFRVAQVKELLALGADGIHCSTSAHSRHLVHPSNQLDFYGYSEPIVKSYQQQLGVDIRSAEDFDREAWHDLKGQAMVELYRALADVCHGQGRELWIGLQLGRYTQFCVNPHFSANAVARYANHWQQLVDEGIANAFIVGDYEQVSCPEHEYWHSKTDIQRDVDEDLYAWARRQYQAYCREKTKLYLFSEWLPAETEAIKKRIDFFADAVLKNHFDGIDVHEAANFEFAPDPAKLPLLGRMAKRLHRV